jgi:uncharacterized damage-inducible protein DinB
MPTLAFLREGWEHHQRLVLDALRGLTPAQLDLRIGPTHWAVWQLAAHVAGARAHWFHDVLGEGDPAVREVFRVRRTTVPGLPLEDAGWEDDTDHPRAAADLVEAYERTWTIVQDCLRRWTDGDLEVEFPRERPSGTQMHTRGWVVWHVLEHDVHHGGEISLILGTHGLPAPDL